jgi:hypothetical protein
MEQEFEIKKLGDLKYPRLKSISILRKNLNLYDYRYTLTESKELLDSILNNKTDNIKFTLTFKICFDKIFNNMEYIKYTNDDYPIERNFPDNWIPPFG